jgi:hypothetical protein
VEYQSDNRDFPTALDAEIADMLGGPGSVLDRPLAFATFPDHYGYAVDQCRMSLRQIADEVLRPSAASKELLPLLKLAVFGDQVSARRSLRHDDNVLQVDGVEGDYDGEVVSIEQAVDMLRAAGIAGLIYASPSHTPERPRWRVLSPLSETVSPERREELTARLNGALGGNLAGESFRLSQSYYFGTLAGSIPQPPVLVEGSALDRVATGPIYRRPPEPAADDGNDDFDLASLRPTDWDRVKDALHKIPASLSYVDGWMDVVMALHHECGGSDEGFAICDEWSRTCTKRYKGSRDLRSKWANLGQSKKRVITIGTLFHMAKRHGWDPTKTNAPKNDAAADSALRLRTPAECAVSANRGYIVKGLLAPGDMACIFGVPGAGKSLIAPHIAYAVARGDRAFGMRTKKGAVLYVAAEDAHGMSGRVSALRSRRGDAENFYLVDGITDVGGADLSRLLAEVESKRPAMVIIDTLALAFPAIELNNDCPKEGMRAVVLAARKLGRTGAAVVIIHHPSKAAEMPLGHTCFNGALDVSLYLHGKDPTGIVRGEMKKNRNGPCDLDLAFRIESVSQGIDEDGDPITSAIVAELSGECAAPRIKLSGSEQAALAVLRTLIVGGQDVTETEWRKACVAGRRVSGSDDAESRSKAFKRAHRGLANHGLVYVVGEVVRIATDSPDYGNAFDEVDGSES